MKTTSGVAGLAAVLAAALAACALPACGGDDSSGSGPANGDGGSDSGSAPGTVTDGSTSAADVSFSGPSCQNGSVLGRSPTCTACVESQCPDVAGCEAMNCAAYIGCYCACAAGDSSCTSACASMQNLTCLGCFEQGTTCVSGACMAECQENVPTGDASTDAGAEAGPYIGSCRMLQTCCASLADAAATACNGSLIGSQNNQTECQTALAGLEDGGACP